MVKLNFNKVILSSWKDCYPTRIKYDFIFSNDVYLSGSKTNSSFIHYKNKLDNSNPRIQYSINNILYENNQSFKEEIYKLQSRVLVYVFDEENRGIINGVEASFFMGLGKIVLLHVEIFKRDEQVSFYILTN